MLYINIFLLGNIVGFRNKKTKNLGILQNLIRPCHREFDVGKKAWITAKMERRLTDKSL